MPTIDEVCSSFGLTDVDIQYSDADLENLSTYKLFQQHVRPLLVKENPKVISPFPLHSQSLLLRAVCPLIIFNQTLFDLPMQTQILCRPLCN